MATRWVPKIRSESERLRCRVVVAHGTVDYLAAAALPDDEIGSFGRVVPNGDGCDFIFTRFFPDAMSDGEVAEERAVVAVELQTVRALCERGALRAAA